MELINATRMAVGYTLGMEASGRELLVVVVKGTFVLPKGSEEVRLHDEQVPMIMADVFSGDPGFSAPLAESDFAPRKMSCDVLLQGSAYAPGGLPVERVEVCLQVGPLSKRIAVIGDRVWEAGLTGVRAAPPAAFIRQQVSYDVAFGGVDRASGDPSEHDAYRPNPAGRGFHRHLKSAWVDGRPLPNTEEPGHAVTWPAQRYRPMAFGPIGRGWAGRCEYAGTYDQHWVDEVSPFLPADFDERYFQAAPADQQLPPPRTPLDVTLSNLTPDGLRHFTLPHFDAPVNVFSRRGAREDLIATLDTIVFEPDLDRFTMSWRLARPLKRNLFEIGQVLVGRKGRDWWQEREEIARPIAAAMPVELAS